MHQRPILPGLRFLLAAVALLLAASCGHGARVIEAGGPGEFSPDVADTMTLYDLSGNSATLSEAFPRRFRLVVFFTTYASPMVDMVPTLNDLHLRWRSRGLVVVGVSMDLQPEAMLRPFVEELQVCFPVVVGDEMLRRSGVGPLGKMDQVPTYWLVDPRGELVWNGSGPLKADELEAVIRAYVAPANVARAATE